MCALCRSLCAESVCTAKDADEDPRDQDLGELGYWKENSYDGAKGYRGGEEKQPRLKVQTQVEIPGGLDDRRKDDRRRKDKRRRQDDDTSFRLGLFNHPIRSHDRRQDAQFGPADLRRPADMSTLVLLMTSGLLFFAAVTAKLCCFAGCYAGYFGWDILGGWTKNTMDLKRNDENV